MQSGDFIITFARGPAGKDATQQLRLTARVSTEQLRPTARASTEQLRPAARPSIEQLDSLSLLTLLGSRQSGDFVITLAHWQLTISSLNAP